MEEDHSTVQLEGPEFTKRCPFSAKQCRTADKQGIVVWNRNKLFGGGLHGQKVF